MACAIARRLTVNINVGTGDFSLVIGSLYVCGHVRMRSPVSHVMDCVWGEKCRSIFVHVDIILFRKLFIG